MTTFPPFNFPLMELLCKELDARTANTRVMNCLPNDLRRFYFLLQGKECQEALFFCFSPPFLRFHLATHASVMTRPTSLHPLNAYLQNGILKNSTLLQQDRILQLTFQTSLGECFFIGEFFDKHPNYHLIQPDGAVLFSLHTLERTHYRLPLKRSNPTFKPPIWSSHQEIEQAYRKLEEEWEFAKHKNEMLTEAAQETRKLLKKEQLLLENLSQCSHWEDAQHEGELIKSQLSLIKRGASSIAIHDWLTDRQVVLNLDPSKTPLEEMTARFRKAKKLQAGIAPLTQFLKKIQEDLGKIQQKEQKIEHAASVEDLLCLRDTPSAKTLRPAKKVDRQAASVIYREYFSASGIRIWVGKNAKANDRLTFQLANGRDWWLHIRGCPGSHVVIRVAKDQEPDPETLNDALQLALYFSKARASGEGEVCLTQRKYVSKLGKAGLAQVSKHQSKQVRLDLGRIKALQERQNHSSSLKR